MAAADPGVLAGRDDRDDRDDRGGPASPVTRRPPRRPGQARAAGWLWASVLLTAGALCAAVALAPPAGASSVPALSWLLFTGSSAHVAATGWLFTRPEVRAYARAHPVRCRWVPATLVVASAAAAAAVAPAAFGWLLLPYFCWQFLHYQKQNIGMAALAASAQRVRPLRPAERRPLLLAGVAAIAALIARPGLLGLTIEPLAPFLFPILFPIAAAGFTLAVAAGGAAIARRPRTELTPGFCVSYLTSLLFCLPAFVFSSPYAAVGGMTVAHGLQYLLLVGLVAGSGSPGRPGAAATRSAPLVRLALLANIALIGGAALSAASHLHNAGPLGRVVFGAYLGIVMTHFVIDAGLWRIRDPLAFRFLAGHLPYLVRGAPAPTTAATDPSSADIRYPS